MKRYLPFLIIGAVAAGALGGGTALYRAKQTGFATAAALNAPALSPGTKPGAKPPHLRGDAKAKVTIEEFADFQCPPCAAIAHNLHKYEQDYRGQLRVVFRHYPLKNHQHARPAALAAEAAALQGKFWEMHDLLYKNQTAWSKATEIRPILTGYAASLGLDLTKFSADMDKPETSARITTDQDRAESLGVKQTPTLFVNNEIVPVASLNGDALRAVIDAALAPKPTP